MSRSKTKPRAKSWKPWGDHPIIVTILVATSIVGVIVTLWQSFVKEPEKKQPPSIIPTIITTSPTSLHTTNSVSSSLVISNNAEQVSGVSVQANQVNGGVHINMNSVSPLLPTATPTFLPFSVRGRKEILLLVASFYAGDGITIPSQAHYLIYKSISDVIQELDLPNIRVEVEPTVIKLNEVQKAEALARQYDAQLIIWGHESYGLFTIQSLNLTNRIQAIEVGNVVEDGELTLKGSSYEIYGGSELALAENEIDAPLDTVSGSSNQERRFQFVTQELPTKLIPIILLIITDIYRQDENYDLAVKTLAKAIDYVRLSLADEPEELAKLYSILGQLYLFDLSQYDLAIENYDKAIQLSSINVSFYNQRGIAYYRDKRYEEAIINYQNAIRLEPSPMVYLNLGDALEHLGNYDEAIDAYGQAMQANPDLAVVYNHRGQIYRKYQETEKAIQDFSKAIELGNEGSYVGRAKANYEARKYEEAIQDFGYVIEHNICDRYICNLSEMFHMRGLAHQELGHQELAYKDSEKAKELATYIEP
jgi:tetratricopeptide (TPR) repeat protein